MEIKNYALGCHGSDESNESKINQMQHEPLAKALRPENTCLHGKIRNPLAIPPARRPDGGSTRFDAREEEGRVAHLHVSPRDRGRGPARAAGPGRRRAAAQRGGAAGPGRRAEVRRVGPRSRAPPRGSEWRCAASNQVHLLAEPSVSSRRDSSEWAAEPSTATTAADRVPSAVRGCVRVCGFRQNRVTATLFCQNPGGVGRIAGQTRVSDCEAPAAEYRGEAGDGQAISAN